MNTSYALSGGVYLVLIFVGWIYAYRIRKTINQTIVWSVVVGLSPFVGTTLVTRWDVLSWFNLCMVVCVLAPYIVFSVKNHVSAG